MGTACVILSVVSLTGCFSSKPREQWPCLRRGKRWVVKPRILILQNKVLHLGDFVFGGLTLSNTHGILPVVRERAETFCTLSYYLPFWGCAPFSPLTLYIIMGKGRRRRGCRRSTYCQYCISNRVGRSALANSIIYMDSIPLLSERELSHFRNRRPNKRKP